MKSGQVLKKLFLFILIMNTLICSISLALAKKFSQQQQNYND